MILHVSRHTRNTDQMCREDGSSPHLSAEEEMEAEESLSVYCKPVELYNILQRRSMRNPSFLQRCLSYKIQVKHKKRIQATVSLVATVDGSRLSQSLFPLYILLARAVPDISVTEYSAVYRFHRACILTNFSGLEGSNQDQANFLLPEINKLALEAKSGSLALLLVSFAGAQSSTHGVDRAMGHLEDVGSCCLLGVIQVDSLCHSWQKSPNLSLGQRVEVTSQVEMKKCFLKLGGLNGDKFLSVQSPYSSETVNSSQDVKVNISAEEVGAKEKSAYNSYTCSDASSSSLSHIIRLRAGNVIFNYRYYNNKLQKTEVTEDFSCPFCLAKCASFKGLRHHLPSSHDLFHFEFWVTEEFQAVNISVKTDVWRSEIVADGIDPKQQTFFFCSKKRRHKRCKRLVRDTKNVHSFILETNSRIGASGILGSAVQASNDPDQLASGNNFAPPAMLQFAKTRKLSIKRPDLRNRALLHKRQFFHSHRAQPMAIEQVLSDRDSEDEVDDDVADFEDRRMLDDFVDVTKDEKQMMHLWNSFVRKQRVLADGHIPWACEAFSRVHGLDLVRAPALLWCWRLFMIKLWNHGLLDARTMNNCNITLEQCQKQDSNPAQS